MLHPAVKLEQTLGPAPGPAMENMFLCEFVVTNRLVNMQSRAGILLLGLGMKVRRIACLSSPNRDGHVALNNETCSAQFHRIAVYAG